MALTRTRVVLIFVLATSWLTPAARMAQPAASADPDDVGSPDAIIAALYDVISGPAGQARNWDRFRSLFLPGARLVPVRATDQGERRVRVMTPQEYIETSGPILQTRGFFERELSRVSETFGGILHAFSTYESRNALDGPVIARGINSIQLSHDGTRWWIATVMWEAERSDNPIPVKYLPGR